MLDISHCSVLGLGCITLDTKHITKVNQCYPVDTSLSKKMQYAQYARKFPCAVVSENKMPHPINRPAAGLGCPTYGAYHNAQVTNHGPNYVGMSKRMEYGRYVRTTPGLETFSGKKYEALQPKVEVKQQCFKILCQGF